jgi:hypothetical protein
MAIEANKWSVKGVAGLLLLGLVLAGGVAALLLSKKNTDLRSQASANKAAQVWIGPRTPSSERATTSQQVGIDASQLNPGTTITSFSLSLLVQRKKQVLGDLTLASEGSAPRSCEATQDCPPTLAPSPVIPTVTPTADVLAQSRDGAITIKGLSPYLQIQQLKVAIDESNPNDYLVTIQGQASANTLAVQTAFAQKLPLFVVVMKEKSAALSDVTVRTVSITGLIPGRSVPTELAQSSH